MEGRKMVPDQERGQEEVELVNREVVQNIMAAGQGCSPSGVPIS
jgi:hypothetical protein